MLKLLRKRPQIGASVKIKRPKQLHVRRGAQISVGVEAFVAIWRQLPYFWILAPIVNFKPVKAVSSVIYRRFLAPLLFAAHKRRRRRGGAAGS
jgi:predicted DCC family thiol-disulfide oxidoreductase YuxK